MKTRVPLALVGSILLLLIGTLLALAAPGGGSADNPKNSANSPAVATDTCVKPWPETITAPYSSTYKVCELPSLNYMTGVASPFGGITFKQGAPNTLLVGDHSHFPNGRLMALTVTRDSNNHITGFTGTPTLVATMPDNDGGLAYGPGSVLFFTRFPDNEIGEFKPGSTQLDNIIRLVPFGVTKTVGSLNFVPAGYPGANQLKVLDLDGNWYSAELAQNGWGTYDMTHLIRPAVIPIGPQGDEGFVFVPPGSPQFTDYHAMLVTEHGSASNGIAAFTLNSSGDPIPSSRQVFMTGLGAAEGAAVDPLTGDTIFSSSSGGMVAVRGFAVPPGVTPIPTFTATRTSTATATPTQTSTPAATNTPTPTGTDQLYWIKGRVVNTKGEPIAGAAIMHGTSDRVYSDSNGNYAYPFLSPGTYTIQVGARGYQFTPNSATIAVTSTSFKTFVGSPLPPVILVHGWLGTPGDFNDSCELGVDHWKEGATFNGFDDMPKWIDGDGYDLWIAHWRTGPMPFEQTLSFEYNATCLANEIATVKAKTGASQVVLIAHSMGGLVSRAYLHSSTYSARRDVKTLITMGSPHTGIAVTILKYFLFGKYTVEFCAYNPGFCEVDPLYMLYFNAFKDTITPNYYLIGGDKNRGPIGWLVWLTDGTNDGLVGLNSSLAKMPWGSDVLGRPAGRYETDENHIDPWGRSYFLPDMISAYSSSYKCIRQILGGWPGSNCIPPKAPQAPQQAVAGSSDMNMTPLEQGHILTGETKTFNVPVDTTDKSNFGLTWQSNTLSFSLVNPNGVTIDAAYATANPSIVAMDTGTAGNGTPAWVTYSFTNTVPGNWTLKVDAPDAGTDGVDFLALTALSSPRTLTVSPLNAQYKIGATAALSATLMSGTTGITGATVAVDIARPDNITDTVTLTDAGNGTYQGSYVMPNAPGDLQATFTASGSDNGTSFTRQAIRMFTVMPQTATLTGKYATRLVDENGDKVPEALRLDVGVNTTTAGNYNVTADLQAGGKLVAQADNMFVSATGAQTVTLRFDGTDIWRSRLNGPYTLTNLRVQDLQLNAPAVLASNLYKTTAYRYMQFAAGTEENRPDIQYNGWRGVMNTKASGSSLRVSEVANDKVTFAFTGSSITWLTKKGPDEGKAQVVIDGKVKGSYDLYSASDQWKVPVSFPLANAAHTITVKVLGTRNASSSGISVPVDAFQVGKTRTEETARTLVFDTWRAAATTTATGGGYRYSLSKYAVTSFTFTGASIDWVTAMGPDYGKAQVLIDGKVKETVDLYAATARWNVVKSYKGLGDGTHTIQVKVLGVHNLKSVGNRVVIDAFSGPVAAEASNVTVPASPDDAPEEAPSQGSLLPLLGLIGASGLAGAAWLRFR